MAIRIGARLASLASAVALGCAGTGVDPDSFQAQIQRDVELPATSEIATADGVVRARVPGRLVGEFAETAEGSHYGLFDIGTATPVGCYLYDERKEPATHLATESDRVFEQIGATYRLGKRAVFAIDAGHAGAYPYLGLDWIAAVDEAGFHLKQKFGNRGERSLYCLHHDAGYTKAFDTFFASFLATLELPDEPDPPQFREISVIRISGHEVGFEVSSVRRNEQGDYRSDTQVAMLLPVSAEEVQPSDDYAIETSRPDGSVIDEVSVSSTGVDLTRLNLERDEEERVWTVRGEMQGKSISESFAEPERLTSAIEEMRHVQNVARGEPAELRYWRWLGATSPEKPVEHVMRKSGDSAVTIEAGPVHLEIQVDELGARIGTLILGRFEMQMERVYIDGSL